MNAETYRYYTEATFRRRNGFCGELPRLAVHSICLFFRQSSDGFFEETLETMRLSSSSCATEILEKALAL